MSSERLLEFEILELTCFTSRLVDSFKFLQLPVARLEELALAESHCWELSWELSDDETAWSDAL